MRKWKTVNSKKKNKNIYNNRINIILAIVFLLGGALIYRLFDLQIQKNDLYNAMAKSQHQVSAEVKSERGDILIERGEGKGEEELYPLATNRDYTLVYAIPKEIKNRWKANKISSKLYNIFDKQKIEREVRQYFEEKDKKSLEDELSTISSDLSQKERREQEAEIRKQHKLKKKQQQWQKDRHSDIKDEIKKRKEQSIESYAQTLTKENDPYEPLHKKVKKSVLKDLYAVLLSNEEMTVAPEDLVIKDGEVFVKKDDFSETDTEAKLKHVDIKGISHLIKSYRYYPEDTVAAHILGFVNYDEGEKQGNYGLEGFFNKELSGEYGSTTYGRGATKDLMIVNDREYVKPKDGSDLVLTIDQSIQFFVCEKIKQTVGKYAADSGSIIVVKPQTGSILAMCSYPTFDPNKYSQVEDMKTYNNPAIFEQYEPGSVFKTITMAAALNEGAVTPQTEYKDKGKIMVDGWDKPIKNSDYETKGGHGVVNMNYVLEHSLNTGAIYAMKQVGANKFADYVKEFGFGQKTGIELMSEAKGDIESLAKEKVPQIYGATASYGQGISVTPLQLVMSYAAIANDGILMKPFIVKKIIHANGEEDVTRPIQLRKVISDKTASLLSGMLVNVVEGGHAKLAAVDGYYVGGKTGTAQVASSNAKGYGSKTIHSFVGFAPIEDPKFVMLVKLDNPGNALYSASSAAPVFGEMSEFILDYYQVSKDR